MGSGDLVGGDDMLCDHAQHDRGGADATLEFENMDDPIELSEQNLDTFDEFV